MIHADFGKSGKPLHNFWNNIHFHPTDAIEDAWGREILDRVAKDGVAETVRLYTMFEDIVSRGEDGRLVYDFRENDTRMDYMVKKGFTLLICYNFIPPCISSVPDGFSESSQTTSKPLRYKNKRINTEPPAKYEEWEEVCYEYTKHIVERYGIETVRRWYLHCYNEPCHSAFFMSSLPNTAENTMKRLPPYLALYRHFASAVTRVDPSLRIGGPSAATTVNFEGFLDGFLEAVAKEGLKFDFYSIHTYGTYPEQTLDGSRPLHAYNTESVHKVHYDLLKKHFGENAPEVIVDEWGAATGGFRSAAAYPALIFREKADYAAYLGKMIAHYTEREIPVSKMMICLSGQHEMEHEFEGYRTLFTLHGIPKPIYNAFAMLRDLSGTVCPVSVDAPNTDALATRDGDRYCVMLARASEHFDTDLGHADIPVCISGVRGAYTVRIRTVDGKNGAPYEYALAHGMTEPFTEQELDALTESARIGETMREMDFTGCDTLTVGLENAGLVLVELLPKK